MTWTSSTIYDRLLQIVAQILHVQDPNLISQNLVFDSSWTPGALGSLAGILSGTFGFTITPNNIGGQTVGDLSDWIATRLGVS